MQRERNHSKQEKPNVQNFQFSKSLGCSRRDRRLGWPGCSLRERERESAFGEMVLDMFSGTGFHSKGNLYPLEYLKRHGIFCVSRFSTLFAE